MTSEQQPESPLPKSSQPQPPGKRETLLWAIALGLFGAVTVGAALLLPKNPVPSERVAGASPTAPDQTDSAESPQAAADDEAARRAEWEAQMQRTRDVLGSMDREALIGTSATKGPLDADVVLIKFSDFQCPYCALASADMKRFTQAHSEDVLYIYKHFPLVTIHDEAMPAARAAWAAGQQDRFWIYHDGLFAFQPKLGEDYYVELAEQIGLDVEKFERDRNSPAAQAAVEKDMELARALGLRGTPSFLMNDLLIPGGAPLELFEEAAARIKAAVREESSPSLPPGQSQQQPSTDSIGL